jgi:autoinducer 2-degrading protein
MEILLVEVHVKPEAIDRFLEVIKEDAIHSEQNEPGCLRFDVLRDTEDPYRFFYYEVYRDAAARAAHRETPHFKKYAEASADMFDRPVQRNVVRNFHPSDGEWR